MNYEWLEHREADEGQDKRLNAAMRDSLEVPEAWDDSHWTAWLANDNGATWWTLLDEESHLPTESNIIEGETGELICNLSTEQAMEQWGENAGMVSMDNGLTYKQANELTEEEAVKVCDNIPANQLQFFPEISLLWDAIDRLGYETAKEKLTAFMERLCLPYVIG